MKNQESRTKSVNSAGLQDIVRLESQGPYRSIKAGYGEKEAAEHRKVDREKLKEAAGELSVKEFNIIIADVILE
jgi:hypothetical protein